MKGRIADNLERSELYRWIRNGSGGEGIEYVILPDEALSAELVSTRIYDGSPKLAWVIRAAAGVEDARRILPVGQRIVVPTARALSLKIKAINDSPALV